MRFDTDIDIKDRKRVVLTEFRGVDAASPVYAVSAYRASAMRNLISINGNNHKRPGWRQIGHIKDENGVGLPINGYFDFAIAHQHMAVIYAGTKFFLLDESTETWKDMSDSSKVANNIDTSRLLNRNVQMFIYGDKAYFIGCGDFLVLGVYDGELQFRRVYNDDKTYTPTTTVNISPNETDYYDDGTVVAYGERQTFRDVNILNSKRINTLIGSDYYMNTSTPGKTVTESVVRTYKLDGTQLDVEPFSIIASDYNPNSGITTEYTLTIGDLIDATTKRNLRASDVSGHINLSGKTITIDTSIKKVKNLGIKIGNDAHFTILKAGTFSIIAEPAPNDNSLMIKQGDVVIGTAKRLNENEFYHIVWESDTIEYTLSDSKYLLERSYDTDERGLNILVSDMPARKYEIINNMISSEPTSGKNVENARVWGTVDFDEGIIELVVHPRTISGESNISVTFSKNDDEYANRIFACRFGALFGSKGNANTLFVAGCDDYPNCDYWSGAGDFTYFPSNNICSVGTTNTRIMGYQRLGDESLAIFKEASVSEPTLYIRTGVASTISDDMSSVAEGYYHTVGKYITEGVVSYGAIGMLNGDALFLSKNGVYGVQINSDSIAVEQRVAKERSRLINPLLQKHSTLETATSIVYDNKFYIAIDNYVYIADARFVFSQKGDLSDTYNYEWWVWDECPIRKFFTIGKELYFGTGDGRICVFDSEYTDRKYEQLDPVTFDINNNRVIHNGVVALSDDDFVYFKGNIYRLLFDKDEFSIDTTNEYNRIKVDENIIATLYESQEVYADSITGNGLNLNTKYYIVGINLVDCTFGLQGDDGKYISPSGTFRLLTNLDGVVTKVKTALNSSTGARYIQLYNRYNSMDIDGNEIEVRYRLSTYNNLAIVATAYKYDVNNVVAEWYTPVMDMGASDYIKVLTRMTLAAQQITDGVVKIGWETKNANGIKEIDSRGLDVFDFNNLNFGNFTFDTGFESAFTKHMKTAFNYILFRFVSDNDCDCCVYSLTVEYKVNRLNKGVW